MVLHEVEQMDCAAISMQINKVTVGRQRKDDVYPHTGKDDLMVAEILRRLVGAAWEALCAREQPSTWALSAA
ncbi:uncharacterized protein PV06_09499 [Exophiala oligosperma]|uniref:Uncharacterized protein n=1 Tax=Exophiala oligosperma TaxID=215243 RepID=A0A0D2D5W1_9EURO|nr:uncharacterized protein PV06_09499 [Exophiala oligosperma]KIW38543.1 hypothetical protein PV06_09499 [Exophiala oligosperma]